MSSNYVDCGECPRISTGCQDRCAKAADALERVDLGPCSGTVTGRMSCSEPQMAELRPSSPEAKRILHALAYGKALAEQDYRQTEARICAVLGSSSLDCVIVIDEVHYVNESKLYGGARTLGKRYELMSWPGAAYAAKAPVTTEGPDELKARIRELNKRLLKPMRGAQRAQCTQQLKELHQKLRGLR